MSWCIYKHTNKVNGKVYIGQTCQRPEDRWRNGKGYEGPYCFYYAIQKYGWDNFSHEILENNLPTVEIANEREKYYIKLYHSCVYDPECNGYNSTFGGEGVSTWSEKEEELLYKYYPEEGPGVAKRFNGKYTSEAVRSRANALGIFCQFTAVLRLNDDWEIEKEYTKISEVELDGYSRGSVLQCCQRSFTKSGNKYWCFKKDYGDDWEPWYGACVHNQPVYCWELQLSYNNAKEAARKTGANYSHILHCCNEVPKYNTSGGYHWCYTKNKDTFVPRYDRDTSQCYCVNDGKFYETLTLAGKAYGCSSSDISAVCRGIQKTTRGLTFCYASEYSPTLTPNDTQNKEVLCLDTGVIYQTLSEASSKTGVNRSSISACCNGKQATAGGMHWCFAKEEDRAANLKKGYRTKRVKNVDTGEEFLSAVEAVCKYPQANRTGIGRCCQKKQKTCGGYHWEYVD